MTSGPHQTPHSVVEPYRALLAVAEAVISHRSLSELFHDLAGRLSSLVSFDYINVLLHDAERDVMRLHLLEPRVESGVPLGLEVPVEGTGAGWVWRTQQPLIVHDIDGEERFPVTTAIFRRQGILSFYSFPLTSAGRRLGTMGFGCNRPEGCSAESLEFLQQVVKQVAVAVENALNFESAGRERDRRQLLLEVSNAVVSNLNLKELLLAVSACLRQFFKHDFASMVLYDEEAGKLRVHALDAAAPGGVLDEGTLLPLEGTPPGLAIKTRQTVLRDQIDFDEFHSPTMRLAYEAGLRCGCSVPLIAHDRVLGTINVGSLREAAFTKADAELLGQVAHQIAIAVENALNFERATKERELVRTLLEVNNAIATNRNIRDLLRATSGCLRNYFRHDFAALSLYDEKTDSLHVHAFDRARPDTDIYEGEPVPVEGTLTGLAFTTRRAIYRSPISADETFAPMARRFFEQQGLQSFCCVPLVSRGQVVGVLALGSRQEGAMTAEEVELLERIGGQIAIAVENALQYREIEGLKNKLASEKRYLEEELKAEYNFAEIVGQSRVLREVLEQLRTVAPTDSVVLICGETGTGKELIARAVHDLSARRERTMVKVNCAAIPTGLLESEFFGHEKGAFTGAVAQRAGRFELAHKGTLFLDEVGEIPLELQPKLLRVLQEHEFERLGGSRTIKVDVRLIAATNCNLREMVAEKKFRSDLFYRLNVFPILLPPLRERAEDIPLLAGYFAQKHSRRMNKRIDAIPSETVEALCRYRWPGNVRELENFIERACILTRGHELQAPLAELEGPGSADEDRSRTRATVPADLLSLADAERAHIEEVLRHTKGVVGGRGGAAEILGLPISTLRGRMKKLGLM